MVDLKIDEFQMPLIWSKNWLNLSAEALDEEGRRKKIFRKFRKCKKVERPVPVKKVKFELMETSGETRATKRKKREVWAFKFCLLL